jgi:uncharacterized protein YbbC (DUF1343 family)
MVRSGLENLAAESFSSLHGRAIGLLANQSAVDRSFKHILTYLAEQSKIKLVKIFAPEHGFYGAPQDMVAVKDDNEPQTGAPIVSLYGASAETLRPNPDHFNDIDTLLVDLPDIGTRYYTFAQTVGYCLEIAKAKNVEVVVLDRPNPLNGTTVEGVGLELGCRSFCGYAPVPQRHGLTLGEHSKLINDGFSINSQSIPQIGAKLRIIGCTGWNRADFLDQTGLPWVIPSPNMPTLETAVVYPGGCLIEATTLSEGRGTTRPFELFGSPGVNSSDWLKAHNKLFPKQPGYTLREVKFLPQHQKHGGELCNGFQIHVTDRRTFQPLRAYISLFFSLKYSHPDELRWRGDAYEFIDNVSPIDLLYGSSSLRTALEAGADARSIFDELVAFESDFKAARESLLLYR